MALRFLSGGGMMGQMMRAHDWSTSPLGSPLDWPLPLRTIAGVMLSANQPMFAVWGPEQAMIYNDGYAEILGGHHPRALGRPFFEAWHELVDEVGPIMARGYAGEPTAMNDLMLIMQRRGYPEETHFSFFYAPLRDELGNVGGVLCGCSEITAQVFAERARVAELDRLQVLFSHSPSFLALLHGPDHVYEMVNPSYLQLIGHRDVVGLPVRTVLPEVAEQGYLVLLDQVYRTGVPYSASAAAVYLQRTPDAAPELRMLDLLFQPRRDAAGNVSGILVNGNDVTETHAAQEKLRLSEMRNRQILDSAIDYAIIATDLDGVVSRWNKGAERILGWREEEMIGQALGCIFTQQDQAGSQLQRDMQAALCDGVVPDERWHLRKSGVSFRARGETNALRDETGAVTGFVKVLRDCTGEHMAAQALAASNDQLQRAQSAGGVGVFTVELDTGRVRATPAFCRIFGLPPTDTLDANDVEATIFPEDQGLMSSSTSRRNGTAPTRAQYRIRRADTGEVRWIARSAEFQCNAAGQPVSMDGVVQDVTERHLAEIQLRNSEEKFRTLAQALPNHVWSARPDGQIDWFNEQVRAYAGEDNEALAGAGWLSIVHPDDAERALAAWLHALANQTVYEVEFRIRRHDGAYRWFLARALPMRDAEGRVTHWLGTNTDMEDQRAAREILVSTNAALEQRVEAQARERDRIWNLSQDLLVIVGADAYFRDVNPACMRILGLRPDEIVGRHIGELVYPPDRELTLQSLAQAAHEPVSQFENRYLHKDGSPRWFSWSASHDSNGVVYANGRHITAEKEAAIALARTEEALRHAQKMDAVGQLTGGIAHDFNNLLQGITGSLELLRLRVDAGRFENVDRFVSGAINSANRAAALTHRLLAFSRRQPLDPKAVKVNPLVASMEDLLRRTLGERIRIELVLAGGLWPTLCDPNQLENAILNLCINARDAMPDGGKLTVETGNAHLDDHYAASVRGLAPGQYACICVTDTGTGMSRDIIDRAFEPFFTTKPLGQGTGLGLSMIYGFAQQSEGHVRIYSEVGQGTTVKLYLPRFRGTMPGEEVVPTPGETQLSPDRETVLVVEDEQVVRSLIVDVLHELGYCALEAEDGPSGLAILQSSTTVDLLVTDIGLPGLNGRQLADAARLLRPSLKVLFMTGYAENAAFANGFLEHGMEMITKPFAMERLAARVREIVERK
nr:PAS domain S-box protein [uncultured Noviherbaspirillum sp.]